MSLSIDHEVSKSTISPKILVKFYTHFTDKWLYHSFLQCKRNKELLVAFRKAKLGE